MESAQINLIADHDKAVLTAGQNNFQNLPICSSCSKFFFSIFKAFKESPIDQVPLQAKTMTSTVEDNLVVWISGLSYLGLLFVPVIN